MAVRLFSQALACEKSFFCNRSAPLATEPLMGFAALYPSYATTTTCSRELVMIETPVAKLFKNGASQAVRLPVDFRFEGDEVYVTRDDAVEQR